MAKLFIITARDVNQAIILRRGPTSWYHLILWDTAHDVFTHGAWMRGRIYEECCDLSPNGQTFLYFVRQNKGVETEYTRAWTAVSRPPWLHSLVAWPQGMTNGGGGRFLTDNRIELRMPVWPNLSRPLGCDRDIKELQVVAGDPPSHQSTGEMPECDWSGRDQQGRLIFTLGGGALLRQRGETFELLADFEDLQPDPQPAPIWAQVPIH